MTQWAEFLRKLNPKLNPGVGRELAAAWRMSDGVTLRKEIPAAELVQEEELAGDPEFAYKLYQIQEMEFTTELDEVEQAARSSGLIYRRRPERIVVRSPPAC